MKKNWFYLFLSMVIVAPLTSCSNDDDELKPNEEQQHDLHRMQTRLPLQPMTHWSGCRAALFWWTRTAKLSVESMASRSTHRSQL